MISEPDLGGQFGDLEVRRLAGDLDPEVFSSNYSSELLIAMVDERSSVPRSGKNQNRHCTNA